ncbi:MAG: inorganic phosphate transporter [Actinobacteria bacterium]|nr:inorganic phosphate transporter [Actinomycetota bacterium]
MDQNLLYVLIILAIIFDLSNGIHDSSNLVATTISSRAMSPKSALFLASIANFVAPFIFGVSVAKTIGEDIVDPKTITLKIILAALLGAIIWNLITWYFGIPSSSSHALVGGFLGSVIIKYGFDMIKTEGIIKILIFLMISPILGLIFGYLFMRIILLLSKGASSKINIFFKKIQIVTTTALSLSHGTNDAQKTMGIITMALVTAKQLQEFIVPGWVIFISALAISLGTFFGGWKLIKTLGGKFYKIRPVHSFAAQLSSSFIILGAALLGGPVSTTHVVSSSILGVGSAERLSKVRWGVVKNIAMTWIITIPFSSLIAAGLYYIINNYL